MKRLFSLLLAGLIFTNLLAQVTTDPEFPVAGETVKIIFDATQGTAGLQDYSGDIYAHTGVITDQSTSGSDWKYVIADWNVNTDKAKLTRISTNIYELEITPDIASFYGVPPSEKIEQMAFVFRSADGSREGKASGGTDIFVDVYEPGLVVEITQPADNQILQKSQAVNISASSSIEADLKLYLNESLIAENTGNTISTNYTFTEGGSNWLIAEASAAGTTLRDSVSVFVREEVITETKPSSYKTGINYPLDNSAALVLWAPQKEFVYVLGDFNNWEVGENFQMKKDGDYFWLNIPNLEKGKEYAFQYLIDGKLKIADPYAEKVLDPWNDSFVSDATYPNLKAYPEGKTDGIVAVLQPGQNEYQWEINDFQTPAKEKMVIYELLIRDFTEEHTYTSVIEKLDYLEDLRVNVLELMPVNEFEGNNSWGYNPSFYFAPDKFYGPKNELKRLIDECHKRGIAVVIDMVLNHSYGQSPFAQMYMDNWTITEDNPWYNISSPNSTYSWGYDFNHESQATQELVDSVNSFWISKYKVDGFRFDFTKGFTQKTGDGWAYDASRIAILKRMADQIWARDPDNLIILEHLTDNSEEKELANYGLMLWGNMNNNYGEAAMGFNENSKSDLSWAVYTNRGWSQPNLVTYMESHDEERLAYRCLNYGNSDANYDTKTLSVALDRLELNSLFFLPLPGPKMIWQFGERGYDLSINRCENGTISNDCRTAPKPPYWNYLDNSDRTDLFEVMAKLNELKQKYEEFSPESYSYSLSNAIKWYSLSNNGNHVLAVGNFDVKLNTPTISFPQNGKWYEFFTGDSLNITSTNRTLILQPGEYRLYSTRKFAEPHITTDVDDIQSPEYQLNVYPNPVQSTLFVSAEKWIDQVEIYSLTGKLMSRNTDRSKEKQLSVEGFSPGIYLLRVILDGELVSRKIVVQ